MCLVRFLVLMHLIGTIRTVDVSFNEWWWQNDAENDVLNERYKKHGNIISGSIPPYHKNSRNPSMVIIKKFYDIDESQIRARRAGRLIINVLAKKMTSKS